MHLFLWEGMWGEDTTKISSIMETGIYLYVGNSNHEQVWENIGKNDNFEVSLPKYNGSSLKSLKYLDLFYCNFTEAIPTTLENFTQITYLILSRNNFIGSIPPKSLGNLTQITLFGSTREQFYWVNSSITWEPYKSYLFKSVI